GCTALPCGAGRRSSACRVPRRGSRACARGWSSLPSKRTELALPDYAAHRRVISPLVKSVYRLEVRGVENVPPLGPVVVVANHESVLDPFVLGSAIPRPLRFLAKSELWRVSVLARWLDALGAIPIVRGGSDTAAVGAAVDALGADEVVALFPE